MKQILNSLALVLLVAGVASGETKVQGTVYVPSQSGLSGGGFTYFVVVLDSPIPAVPGNLGYEVLLCVYNCGSAPQTKISSANQTNWGALIGNGTKVTLTLNDSEALFLNWGVVLYPIEVERVPEKIQIPGSDVSGVSFSDDCIDPSLRGDPDGKRLWLSYGNAYPGPGATALIGPRLALSYDNGATWSDMHVQTFVPVPVPMPGFNDVGAWEYESSNLVYDQDAPNIFQKWKLLSFRYLRLQNFIFLQHSWIALKTSFSPEFLPYSAEQKLFVGNGYTSSDDIYGGPPELRLDTIQDSGGHFPLAKCISFGEPGALSAPGALYVSISCAAPTPNSLDSSDQKIYLVKLTHPSETWSYVGAPLIESDAPNGTTGWTGSDMFSFQGSQYLVASPVASGNVNYLGCMVFRFTSLALGQLERVNGVPVVYANISPASGGACTFDALATRTGILSDYVNLVPGNIYARAIQNFAFPAFGH